MVKWMFMMTSVLVLSLLWHRNLYKKCLQHLKFDKITTSLPHVIFHGFHVLFTINTPFSRTCWLIWDLFADGIDKLVDRYYKSRHYVDKTKEIIVGPTSVLALALWMRVASILLKTINKLFLVIQLRNFFVNYTLIFMML